MSFDAKLAQRAIDWFPRYLKHTKGRWRGAPFELLPWQAEIVGKLFGTLTAEGYRQIRTVYCEVGKKNGKSELAAGIALRLTFADREPGAEIYSAACDRDQAAIVFNVAADMVRLNPKLAKRCKIIDTTKRIVHNNGSFYRVLSAESYTKHGFNPHGIIFDELHAQPNRDLWDVLTEGAGDARTQPVIFAITTAGYDRHSICWELHEYALKVKRGIIKDPTFLPVVHAAEDADNWEDEKTWAKANPSLGVTISPERLRQAYQKAKEVPALENKFRRWRLCQWVKQEVRYIPMGKWRACGGPLDEAALRGKPCWAGLDLSSTTDLTALVLAFRLEKLIAVLCRFWIPEANIEARVRRDRVPYDAWKQQGLIKTTPGNVIDYDFIEAEVAALSKVYDMREIAFDRHGAVQVSVHLAARGFTMVDFDQGFGSMNAPTKDLLKVVLGEQLRHGDDPVLAWMADNMVVTQNAKGEIRPDKEKSTEKIDGMVGLVMAMGRLQRNAGLPSAKFVNEPTPRPQTAGMRKMEF